MEKKERPVNPILATYPESLPSRQYLDSPSISPRYWGTSHTSSPVRRALLYRRRSRDRSCLPAEFYGRAFYICGGASHGKPRTHPARHKQLECIDQGRIQPCWCGAVVAWLSRGRETAPRKKISTMAFVPSRSASSVLNKINFLSP